MRIKLNSNEIYEILKLSKAKDISFIGNGHATYIIANDLKDVSFNSQVIKKIYNGCNGQTLISKDLLKLIPKYTKVEITEDTIIAGKRKIKYVPNNEIDKSIMVENYLTSINGKELKHLLSGYYAMSTTSTRPILNSVCIDTSNFVALDGYRLTVRKGNYEAKEQIIMDINLVNTLKKIKYDKDVEVYYNYKYVKFKFGELEVIGNRVEGNYIKYNQIIPSDYTLKVEKLETKTIVDILKDYKRNKFELVKLNLKKDKLTISVNNEVAKVEETINIKMQGQSLEIAFNINYLLDALKDYKIVTLELYSEVSPLVIKSFDKLDLVLPVRLKN